jgi:methylmalonyl-CoA/ethylmalonyl-CoA epimerase
MVYELIAPFGDSSPIARTLKSGANLLNQIAYRTSSLDSGVKQVRAMGALPVGAAAPALAFGGAPVQFMMLPLGFVIELIEVDRIVHVFS